MTPPKLRMADLFRSHSINRGNSGRSAETSDDRLDKHEVCLCVNEG